MIRLGRRLQALAQHVVQDGVMADIGCDHGRLCVSLLQRGHVPRAVGVDASAASLQKACRLAGKVGVQDRLDCRQGDGLEPLEKGEAASIVAAGMGGRELAGILARGLDRLGEETLVVFQPMQGQDVLRRTILSLGLNIIDEDLVAENGRVFDVVVAGKRPAPPYDPEYAALGYRLWEKRHPLLKGRAEQKLRVAQDALNGLALGGGPSGEEPEALRRSVRLYEEMLKWL